MTSPVVVVPADSPRQIADSPQLARLREVAEVITHQEPIASATDLQNRVQNADAIINSRSHVKWPEPLLARLPKLRMIATCSIGTDAIDLSAAARLGIVVSNIPGKTAPVVAEHALALILATAKRLAFQTAELKAGRWTATQNVMLAGKTLGVVGTGAIGSQMVRLGRAIGMNVVAWTFNPSEDRAAHLGVRFVELDELLRASDVVSLHVKLTDQTRGLIGARELKLMRAGSLLINSARGAVVDAEALVAAVLSGHLAGCGLDVFDPEPLPADHPILTCDQVVLSPHNADQTPEGIELLNEGAVDNVLAFLRGTPENVVT